MECVGPELPASPIFIGGTGRCGTHVIASLAGRSGRYVQVPTELRVHCAREGLPGFADGIVSRGELMARLRRQWRHRPDWDPVTARGIHRIAPRRRYAAALARLGAAPPGADRLALSRRFVTRLLDPLAPAPGAWVEKSPDNCASGRFLHELYPALRLVHVIRDGRDSACSLMRVPWAPDDFASALALWERRLLEAHLGTLAVPGDQVYRVLFEDLVSRDRDPAFLSLLAFLGIPDEPPLREFFDAEVTSDRAGIGRWRSDLPATEHSNAEAMYREALDRLEAAGVAPLPRSHMTPPAISPARRPERRPRSSIDPWAATTAGTVAA